MPVVPPYYPAIGANSQKTQLSKVRLELLVEAAGVEATLASSSTFLIKLFNFTR
jgi:hypothetical protein